MTGVVYQDSTGRPMPCVSSPAAHLLGRMVPGIGNLYALVFDRVPPVP